MPNVTTINGSDVISTSRSTINTNFSNLDSNKIETSVIDTDTTLAANSDAKIPSQKAVKAYVDGVGVANATTVARGLVEIATQAEVDAGTATGGTGAKLAVTPDLIKGSKQPVIISSFVPTSRGDTTTQFDITNPSGTTFRYTYDGNGTDPNINATTFPVGARVFIQNTPMSAGNLGTYTVTGSGANYFEVTNASGVVESNKTLNNGALFLLQTTTTYSKPAGLKYVIVETIGGGGAGGTTATASRQVAGGGGGGYSKKVILAGSLGSSETVSVGTGGAWNASAGTGGTGGTSSFGTSPLLQATGGVGGQNASTGGGGTGGVGTLGDINATGGAGGGAQNGVAAENAGKGGDSIFGGGAVAISGSGTAGVSGSLYGGGGGGANSSGSTTLGGFGAPGVIILTEFYS